MTVRGEAEEDAQRLMNALMNFAHGRLKEAGGFAPFAGWLDRRGVEALETTYAVNSELPAREIAGRLGEYLRRAIQAGGIRAAAVASDVQFARRGSSDRRNAVELHIEHTSGYCVDFFVPYRIRKGWGRKAGWRVRFSHPVAQESAARFWSVLPESGRGE